MRFSVWDPEQRLQQENQTLNTLRILSLIVWRIMKTLSSRKKSFTKVLFLPVINLACLVVLRSCGEAVVEDKIIFKRVNIDNLDLMREMIAEISNETEIKLEETIFFTPPSPAFQKVIIKAVEKLQLVGFKAMDTVDEMENNMMHNHILAGIDFGSESRNISTLPLNLEYVIRYNPILKTSKKKEVWATDKLFRPMEKVILRGPRRDSSITEFTGVPPGYMEEGFIPLQHAIFMSYLELKSGLPLSHLPLINMEKFPYRQYMNDEMFVAVKILLPIGVAFVYLFSSYYIVHLISEENQRATIHIMKISRALNWLAWFFILFIAYGIVTLLSVFILSFQWWETPIYDHSNWIPILMFMLCYVCAHITFLFMVSVVFISLGINVIYTPIMHFLTLVPYMFIFLFYFDIPVYCKLVSALLLNTGLSLGLRIILAYEHTGEGVRWYNVVRPHYAGDSLTMAHINVMLLIASVIHIIVVEYIEHRYPPDYVVLLVDKNSIAKSWYYPLTYINRRIQVSWATLRQDKSYPIRKIGNFLLNHLTTHEDELVNEYKQYLPMRRRGGEDNDQRKNQRVSKETQVRNSDIRNATEEARAATEETAPSNNEVLVEREPAESEIATALEISPEEAQTSAAPADETRKYSVNFTSIEVDESEQTKVPERRHSSVRLSARTTQTSSTISDISYIIETIELPPSSSSDETDNADRLSLMRQPPVVNEELFDESRGIQVLNVCKSYKGTKYLKNITMTIHPNEITVILGHQKTGIAMLTQIISGHIPMTSGQVLINGVDITRDTDATRICTMPIQNTAFNDLSAKENLYFYTHIRGMRKYRQIAREIRKYLSKLRLEDMADVPVSKLSYGMARRLSLCCALSGGDHPVICDEPALGLDTRSRHHMWDLLRLEGRARTIIVTSRYYEEADVLGDRIAVIRHGKLECYDKKSSLNQKYCNVYCLSGLKIVDNNFSLAALSNLIFMYIPSGWYVEHESDTHIDISLPAGRERRFAPLLDKLEHRSEQFGLTSISIKRKTLSDVFMITGHKDQRLSRASTINIKEENFMSFNRNYIEQDKQKVKLWSIRAVLGRMSIYLKHKWWVPLIILIIATATTSIELSRVMVHSYNLPKIHLDAIAYPNSEILLKVSSDVKKGSYAYKLAKGYREHEQKFVKSSKTGHKFTELHGRRELVPYILFQQLESILSVETFYVGAADVYPNRTTCLWNNKLMHSAPMSLNLVHESMAHAFIGSGAHVKVFNHPVRFNNKNYMMLLRNQSKLHILFGSTIVIACFGLIALMTTPIITMRTSGTQLLQYISGVTFRDYWMAQFMWDFVLIILFYLYVFLILIVFNTTQAELYHVFKHDNELLGLVMLLILFCVAVLPFVYLLSHLFKRAITGFIVTFFVLISSSFGIILMIPSLISIFEYEDIENICHLFRWSPAMNLFIGLHKIYLLSEMTSTCEKVGGCEGAVDCCTVPSSLDIEYPGILVDLIVLTLLIPIYGYILSKVKPLAWENYMRRRRDRKEQNVGHDYIPLDNDVYLERHRVSYLSPAELTSFPVVVRGISKRIKSKVFINDISFAVEPQDIFGLVGLFGSGKSKTIELVAGMFSIDKGEIFVYGINVRHDTTNACKGIGFCPRANALFDYMTVREIFAFYCALEGRKEKYINAITTELAMEFDLMDKLDTLIEHLVFANKRKLTVALAMLGSSKILLLDEPTYGMDPDGRAQVWHMIKVMQKMGRTVLLATDSIEECIALCNRIAIMVNGRIQCLGSTEHLTSKFSKGCTVHIYLSALAMSMRMAERQKYHSDLEKGKTGSTIEKMGFGDTINSQNDEDSNAQSLESISNEDTFQPRRTYAVLAAGKLWAERTRYYKDVKSFMSGEIPNITLLEEYEEFLVYYIPFKSLALSKVFQAMEAIKDCLNVASYKVSCTSLMDIYENFIKERVRLWGSEVTKRRPQRTFFNKIPFFSKK